MIFKRNKNDLEKEEISIKELEQELNRVNQKIEALVKCFASNYSGVKDEYDKAKQESLKLQRELSLAKNHETAILIDWESKWDTGAPSPHVISSGRNVILIYYIGDADPINEDIMPLALVEFKECYAFKFGGAGDEVISGHPLWGKGLEYYSAHEILNSRWIQEEEKINSIHSYYDINRWKERKHYMLLFHDEMFECIANGYKIEIFRDNFFSVLQEAQRRLFN